MGSDRIKIIIVKQQTVLRFYRFFLGELVVSYGDKLKNMQST